MFDNISVFRIQNHDILRMNKLLLYGIQIYLNNSKILNTCIIRHIRHLILICLSLHRLEIRDGARAQLHFLIRIHNLRFEPLASRMHSEMVRQATLDNLKVPKMFRTILLS